MRRLLPIGILLACAVIAVWWWWPPTDAPRPAELPVAAVSGAAAPLSAPASAELPVAPAALPAAAQRDAAPTVAGASGPSATLRGRCVDAQGNPLAGVLASLIGWGANDQRVQAWLADHAEPKRIDEKVNHRGRRTVRVPLLAAAAVSSSRCGLQGAARATWNARWSELAAGVTKDLGDIVLAPGTLLRGPRHRQRRPTGGEHLGACRGRGAHAGVHGDRAVDQRPHRRPTAASSRAGRWPPATIGSASTSARSSVLSW